MSEYQYDEFQTLDRRLTAEEKAELQQLSSRAKITSTRATFFYNYGDFRGEPEQVVARYFDIMFYIANWGTCQLIFKFPKAVVDSEWFKPYRLRHWITITEISEFVLLNIEINDEDNLLNTWFESETWLSRLLPLRDDLLNGDLRLLYLAWLRMAPVEYAPETDPIEPPIPPNLNRLSDPLKAFVELIELKKAQSYDEAIALLRDLRDLAEYQQTLPEFDRRFEQLKSDYSRRSALMRRFWLF